MTPDMTPPGRFRKYVKPYYQKLSQKTKAAGKTLVTHMNGKIKALKDEIAESGINVIESFSLKIIRGDMELIEVREAFLGVTILPNFPSTFLRAAMRKYWISFAASDGGGEDEPYMLQVSEDLADDT